MELCRCLFYAALAGLTACCACVWQPCSGMVTAAAVHMELCVVLSKLVGSMRASQCLSVHAQHSCKRHIASSCMGRECGLSASPWYCVLHGWFTCCCRHPCNAYSHSKHPKGRALPQQGQTNVHVRAARQGGACCAAAAGGARARSGALALAVQCCHRPHRSLVSFCQATEPGFGSCSSDRAARATAAQLAACIANDRPTETRRAAASHPARAARSGRPGPAAWSRRRLLLALCG